MKTIFISHFPIDYSTEGIETMLKTLIMRERRQIKLIQANGMWYKKNKSRHKYKTTDSTAVAHYTV